MRSDLDEKFMQHALMLADRAEALGEIPVGAVLVDDEGNIYLSYRIEDLAKKFSCARSTMVAVLQRLESVNLIERERQWNTSYYNHNLPYMTYINEV